MSFEFRELTTKVFLDAEEGYESPCRNESCRLTKEDDDCCGTCGTTTKCPAMSGCDTNTCQKDPDKDDCEGLQTLAFLRQQLRDTLSAG